MDFERLYRFVLAGAFFVTRAKANMQWSRLESRPVDPATGVRSDQVVWLRLLKSIEHYPDRLRRLSYRDPESDKSLVFLTSVIRLKHVEYQLVMRIGDFILRCGFRN